MSKYELEISSQEIKRQVKYADMPVLDYSIRYPQMASEQYPKAAAKLNRYYRSKATALRRYCEGKFYRAAAGSYLDSVEGQHPFYPYELTSEYKVTYNENCTLSLYFDRYQYMGGANGSTFWQANNWDIQSGKEIPLCALFDLGRNCAGEIQRRIVCQIAEQIKNENANYFEGYSKLVGQYFNAKDYYLTSDLVNVFYQETTVAPHSSGIVVFGLKGLTRHPSCRHKSSGDEKKP